MKDLEFDQWISAIPNPSIEVWLDQDVDQLKNRGMKTRIELMRT